MENYPNNGTDRREGRSRGIYILPNLFTTGNLFFGFLAIVQSFHHDFLKAAYSILIASVFDNLDGKVARLARATSQFGVEYDSLADLISFGVAPAFLVFNSDLASYHRLGLLAAFLFATCGALRLARFNVVTKRVSSRFFVGLPIPAGAVFLVSLELVKNGPLSEVFHFTPGFFLAATYLVAILMVSPILYRSFKEVRFLRKSLHTFVSVLLVVLLFVLYPKQSLFLTVFAYTLWGPLEFFIFRYIMKKPQKMDLDHAPLDVPPPRISSFRDAGRRKL
ncbi:MAG: CDP-diacylglycerol--serine O-phosphatidyltransferase [Leptospirales bacterium]